MYKKYMKLEIKEIKVIIRSLEPEYKNVMHSPAYKKLYLVYSKEETNFIEKTTWIFFKKKVKNVLSQYSEHATFDTLEKAKEFVDFFNHEKHSNNN